MIAVKFRWPLVALSMLLVLGVMMHGGRVSPMSMEMAASAASDMDMSGCCDGCGAPDDTLAGGCAAHCVNPSLLPAAAATIAIFSAHPDFYSNEPKLHSRGSAPDPHPPRLSALS